MKRIKLFTVGLSLLLLGTIVSSGQSQINNAKVSGYERNLIAKENRLKRKVVRSRISNFSGRWKGTLYQPEGTLRTKFRFSLRLYQKGKKVTGFSRITVIDSPQYYGVMKLKGTIKKNRLSFTEISITKANIAPDSGWCIKSGKLKAAFSKGKLILKEIGKEQIVFPEPSF